MKKFYNIRAWLEEIPRNIFLMFPQKPYGFSLEAPQSEAYVYVERQKKVNNG